MSTIDLACASALVDRLLAAGRRAGSPPLTVVVLDTGGHDVVLKREDGSGILRADIARGKAWGALGLGHGSRELARRAEHNPRFFAALAALSGGRVVPNPGGILLRDALGQLLGAVGVSGDTADRDEAYAIEATESVGLRPDPG
jgi:uncharacterized protein GlcG (DUF336 family)